MKNTLSIALLVAGVLLLVSGVRTAAAQQESELAQRVAQLEAQLAETKTKHEAAQGRVEEAVVYLRQQAENGQGLLALLDEVEALGFTAGINYQSREVLLAGMRSYWHAQQEDLPKALPPKPVADPVRRR